MPKHPSSPHSKAIVVKSILAASREKGEVGQKVGAGSPGVHRNVGAGSPGVHSRMTPHRAPEGPRGSWRRGKVAQGPLRSTFHSDRREIHPSGQQRKRRVGQKVGAGSPGVHRNVGAGSPGVHRKPTSGLEPVSYPPPWGNRCHAQIRKYQVPPSAPNI